MTSFPRATRHLVSALVLPLLLAPIAAGAAPKAKPRAIPARPAAASSAIIPLPLNPIVPAAQRACTARTASGLGYTMLRPATGAKPAAGDVALVNYIGYLAATGAVFDQGMRSPLPVDGVIPGFGEALKMLPKAGVARFCIPAAIGYGARETGPIPANSDLVFQVELLDYKTAAEVQAMQAPPTPAPAVPAP